MLPRSSKLYRMQFYQKTLQSCQHFRSIRLLVPGVLRGPMEGNGKGRPERGGGGVTPRHSPLPNSLPQTWKGGKGRRRRLRRTGKKGRAEEGVLFTFFLGGGGRGGETDTAAFTNSVFLPQS